MNLSRGTALGHRQAMVSGLAAVGSGPDVRVAEEFALSLPWYVVHTKVRQEQTAGENLARQGYVVYLPKIEIADSTGGCNTLETS